MLIKLIALILLLLSLPLWIILYFLVRFSSRGPFLFSQKRMGKERKIFTIYKIRTMVEGADQLQEKLKHLNQTDGPVFKIRNDPRYVSVGRILSRTGVDELPQLINVLKGDMNLIGPRPLPVNEAKKIAKKYTIRFKVKPGITSRWVVSGAHKLSFDDWMKLDLDYIKNGSFQEDLKIGVLTLNLMLKNFVMEIYRLGKRLIS